MDPFAKIFKKDGELKWVVVDEEHAHLLKKVRLDWDGNSWRPKIGHQLLHRIITKCPANLVVDHIDHDPLNNRMANLRITTRAGNNENRTKLAGTSSVHKGVCKLANGRWLAYIYKSGKRKHLGCFATESAAGLAYNEAAKQLFEVPVLNNV